MNLRPTQVKRRVADEDRRWFEHHPHATRRWRRPVEGEFGAQPVPPGGFVIVTKISTDLRVREHYGPSRGVDDAVFLVNEATGEVIEEVGTERWQ